MAGFWGRRGRVEAEQALDADLSRRAQQDLVAADERIRLVAEELAFAEAELGEATTAPLREALAAVRTHMGEAFRLHQLNHDELPDTVEELRARNARIVQLCTWARELLDERTAVLADDVARVRQAPRILERVRDDTARLRSRVEPARTIVGRLSARYSMAALRQVAGTPDEAEAVLGFAEHSAAIAAERRVSGRVEEANLALEAATEAVRRAETMLASVEDFEIEALRAESTLADVVADSRADLLALRDAPATPAVAAAATDLEGALAALAPAGVPTDPFGELSRLRAANSALDAAVAAARERAERPLPTPDQIRHAEDAADHQLAVARALIAGHRGWIGADARTRLAEAERVRAEGHALAAAEETAEERLTAARRAGELAADALQSAQRDIDSSRPPDQDWGRWGPGRGARTGRSGMGDMMGPLIGGALLGGILGDIFD